MATLADIEVFMSRGQWEDAEAACRSQIATQPVNPKPYAYLGLIHFRRGEFEQSILELRRAVDLDPKFVDAGVKLAQAYDRLGRYEEAFEVVTEFLPLAPDHRSLTALQSALQHRVKGNRTDGWERTRGLERRIVHAKEE